MLNSLQDSLNRKITYLRLSITDRCNLRCTYCMPAEGIEWKERAEILCYEEILRVVTAAAERGIRKVRVTGGEPLVRKAAVDLIAALARVAGIEEVALSTNGVLFKPQARALFAAGLRKVNFSLDTLNPDKFVQISRRDEWGRVWAGIVEAERLGFGPIKLNVVAQKGVNDDEIVEIARLTLTRPYHVRYIELMPCGSREMWRSGYLPMAEMKARIEAELGPLSPETPANSLSGPARAYRLPGGYATVGFISAISDPGFCSSCNRIRMTADGKLYPCLFGDVFVDFKEALRRGCTNDEIGQLLDRVMGVKPEGHDLKGGESQKSLSDMVHIGG